VPSGDDGGSSDGGNSDGFPDYQQDDFDMKEKGFELSMCTGHSGGNGGSGESASTPGGDSGSGKSIEYEKLRLDGVSVSHSTSSACFSCPAAGSSSALSVPQLVSTPHTHKHTRAHARAHTRTHTYVFLLTQTLYICRCSDLTKKNEYTN